MREAVSVKAAENAAPFVGGVPQFTPEFLEATRELEKDWRSKFDAIARKFGVDPKTYLKRTDLLPVKPVYFPHDIADMPQDSLSAAGSFSFTRAFTPAIPVHAVGQPAGDRLRASRGDAPADRLPAEPRA